MSKRITVTLSDEEYADLERAAKGFGQPTATFAADAICVQVETVFESEDAQAALDEWALRMIPPAGNA